MVIITIGVNRRLHSVTNFFITQLALGDLCILVFCMPFTVTAAYFFKVRLISNHSRAKDSVLYCPAILICKSDQCAISINKISHTSKIVVYE